MPYNQKGMSCFVKLLSGDVFTVAIDGVLQSLDSMNPTPKGFSVSLFRADTYEPWQSTDHIEDGETLLALYSLTDYRYIMESPDYPTDVVDADGKYYRRWEICKTPKTNVSSEPEIITFFRDTLTRQIIRGEDVNVHDLSNADGIPLITISPQARPFQDLDAFLESHHIPVRDFFKLNTIMW